LLALTTSVAVAAPTDLLSANTDSYDDPTWRGSVNFYDTADGRVLSGRIDFAVFLATDFNANYPLHPQPGPVVYAYQIFVDNNTIGSDISHLSVSLFGPPDQQYTANDIGFIPSYATGFLGGSAPSNYSLDPIDDPLPGDHI